MVNRIEWQQVKADMLVQTKLKIARGELSPMGLMAAQSLLKQLEDERRLDEYIDGGATW